MLATRYIGTLLHMRLGPSLLTMTNYAQIKKELLSIVFGVERFEGYLYGRKVFFDTDHKPLESIVKCTKAAAENAAAVTEI